MAKSRAFYKKDYARHIGATILLATSFLGLVFLCCGVPLGVLMLRQDPRACNTLWGFRPNCWAADYSWRAEDDPCQDRRERWAAAEAFAVVAIFALLFSLGGAWAVLSGHNAKTATALIAAFAVGTTTVPWAIVTALYYTHYCGDYEFTHFTRKLGTGYILMVVSFAIQCVGLVLFLFLEPEHPPAKEAADGSAKANSSSSAKASEPHEEKEEEE